MGAPKLADTQKDVAQINIKAWLQKHNGERKLSLACVGVTTYTPYRQHVGHKANMGYV